MEGWVGGGFEETLKNLSQGWKMVRPGGFMGGEECKDAFVGDPSKEHRWLATRQAVEQWGLEADVRPFEAGDGSWIAFKQPKPAPEEILVISAATADVSYARHTKVNHADYCRHHGYSYKLFGEEVFERDKNRKLLRPGACYKIQAILRAMESSKCRWIYWIDVDAIFNNFDVEVAHFALPSFDIVCPTWEDLGRPRPSTGTILVQNTSTSREILEAIWSRPMSETGQHEEDVFRDVVRERPELAKRVWGLPTRYLNSTPPHGNTWEPDDFVLHFLSVKGDREEMLRDAIAMAKMWAKGGA